MARLVILPAARMDLIQIGDFIALDNPERAASFVAEIESRMIEVPSPFLLHHDASQQFSGRMLRATHISRRLGQFLFQEFSILDLA